MINKDTVRSIVEEWLDGKEYFLVDIEISPDDRIVVEIDHADGVWIEDCVELSRFIEDHLSRDEEDSRTGTAVQSGSTVPLLRRQGRRSARRRRKEVQRRTQSRRGQRLHCDGAGEAESGRQEAPTTRGDRLHLPDGQSEIYKILNKFQISYGSSKKRRRGEHVRLFQGV